MGWPLQLLSSRLSPAICPHLPVPSRRSPRARQTADMQSSPAQGLASCSRDPPQVCICPFRSPLFSRGLALLSGVSKGHPHICTPDSGPGSPALPADRDVDEGGTWPSRGRSVQWACHNLRPGSHQERHPCQGPLQHPLPARHVLCSASPWLERARVDRLDAWGSCTSLAPSPDPQHRSGQLHPRGCSGPWPWVCHCVRILLTPLLHEPPPAPCPGGGLLYPTCGSQSGSHRPQ